MKIQLKRSNVLDGGKAKEPIASQMEYGELAVNYNENDPSLFIKDSNNNIVKLADLFSSGDGALTIQTSGGDAAIGTFTANQSGPSTLTLPQISYTDLKDIPPNAAAPGDGALTIQTAGGDTATGTFTANQVGPSTLILPAIAYSDLTGTPSIPADANDGALTIQTSGGDTATGTFTANQAGASTLTLPQISYTDLKDIPPNAAVPGNGALTIKTSGGSTASGTFTANQVGASTLTLPAINYADLTGKPTIPAAANNGALTIKTSGGDFATGTFTANQASGSTLTLPQISYTDLKDVPPNAAVPGNGTITIKQPGTAEQTFTVNQSNNTTINLKNDNTVVTPGNGALKIQTSGGDIASGTFTANQAGASTITLPAIPYSDLTGKPTIPAAANNGALTIQTSGGDTATGTFTANQAAASTIVLPAIPYSDLTGKPTIPAAAGNGTITIKQPGTNNQTFTVNQSGNTTINLKNDNTVVTPGNGSLTIKTAGENKSASGSFTANQSGASTITLPTIRYGDLSGRPTIPAAAGNGRITIVQPGTDNQSFTVNQSGNTTITLKNDNTQASTNLNKTGNSTSVTISSSTGSDATITGATTGAAGVMTAAQVTALNGKVNKSGDTMTGSLTLGSNQLKFSGTSTSIVNTNKDLVLAGNNGAGSKSVVIDTGGMTLNGNAGIRYTVGNAWIAFEYASGTQCVARFNGGVWGNIAISSSDVRLKENVNPIANGLSIINQLKPVGFEWKDDNYYTLNEQERQTTGLDSRVRYGFIADEVAEVIPEALVQADPSDSNPDPMKDYDNRAVIAMLCKAVQELSAKVETLEAQLSS